MCKEVPSHARYPASRVGGYEVRFRGRLGPGEEDDRGKRILNRVGTWTEKGIQYEADQRHVEFIVQHADLGSELNSVSTPWLKLK